LSAKTIPRSTCDCYAKLSEAEAELREKAKRHPESAGGYEQAALEIQRVRHARFGEYVPCSEPFRAQLATVDGREA